MPKPQYAQKFRDCWLRDPGLKDWLQVVESTGGPVAKCKMCGTLLFSSMNLIKTKQRNRMKVDLLSAILTVRAGLSRESKCCNNYLIPNAIAQKIGTKEFYSILSVEEADSSEDDLV